MKANSEQRDNKGLVVSVTAEEMVQRMRSTVEGHLANREDALEDPQGYYERNPEAPGCSEMVEVFIHQAEDGTWRRVDDFEQHLVREARNVI